MADLARDRDRGSVVVEAALALPLALLLVLQLIQGGALLRTYSGAVGAVRNAARAASIAGADPFADQQILAALDHTARTVRPMEIRAVVIWHGAQPGEGVPAPCRALVAPGPNTTSVGVSDGGLDTVGACNVYRSPDQPGGAFDMATGRASHPASWYFGCQGPTDPAASHLVDCSWPGKDRRTATSPRSATGTVVAPDLLGIWIQLEHRFAVAAPLSALTLDQATTVLLEPDTYAVA